MKGNRTVVFVSLCLMHCFWVMDAVATVYSKTDVVNRVDLTGYETIKNYGTINSIYTNGNNLQIYNYGTVGFVNNAGGISFVHQYIPDNSALHKINVGGGNFSVDVTNVNQVNLIMLKDVVAGAEQVNIANSSIIINDFADWRQWNQNVLLSGANTLYLVHPETVISGERIQFVQNNGTTVVLLDSDKLYKVSLRHDSGASFIDVTKETDMSKIFDDGRSDVLKDLYSSNSNNALLNALNSANNIQEVDAILQSSYRFNPSILMRPVTTLNQFILLDFLSEEKSLYGGLSGFYIGSDTTKAFGFNFDIDGKYEDFYLGVSVHFNRFYYNNDMNDFDGFSYGGNIKIKKYIDDFWLRGVAGVLFANFRTDTIYHDNVLKKNPFGYAGYGVLDFGFDYVAGNDLVAAPFIGMTAQIAGILGDVDTDFDFRVGGNVKYSVVTDGLKYEYSGMAGATIMGDLFGGVGLGFMSELDGAGVSMNIEVLKNDDNFNYKIALNGKVLF